MAGKATVAQVTLPDLPIVHVFAIRLVEEDLRLLAQRNGLVAVPVAPYATVTLRLVVRQ